MKVILLQDIDKIGRKYEVKSVADGHARNFLIPKGLVKPATEEALKWLEAELAILKAQAEEDLKKVQVLATSIDGLEVLMPIKLGEKKEFFEAINAQKISDKLKEMGFGVKKSQIVLEENIKELGEFPVKVRFSHNLEVEIKIIITEEKKS